ncbi:hypothetical protein BDQ17DRAFT_1348857 [Cyathus striatus]|nr:hypothetical protein BDQ17DRAFT_1348857 [Cyathus striatus]
MPCNRSVQKKSAKEKGSSASHPVQMGTPVTNAHSGISLQDLRSRAERFRSRTRDVRKLSRSGRPLRDYRCYVIGCDQINKRKDHMITHIGGHLDQRLFQCSHCPSRFLRKNELKRHELGHTGLRPFACHMCCLKRSTFVRRDLLLRHIKRMHKDEANATKGKSHAVKKVKTK